MFVVSFKLVNLKVFELILTVLIDSLVLKSVPVWMKKLVVKNLFFVLKRFYCFFYLLVLKSEE